MSIEALKTALEALEEIHPGNITPMAEESWNKAITALRQAIAKAQEAQPVAWRWLYDGKPDSEKHFPIPGPSANIVAVAAACEFPRTVQYLYAAPPQRKPLTDEEAIRYAQECSKSAYQRGYLDGIHRDCPHCADYKAMYLRVRDELAALQQSKEST